MKYYSIIRDFRPEDAPSISALFMAVYGEHYVYPDVYLPTMIRLNNAEGRWRSAVAELNGRIVGHAILWMDPHVICSAEFAMNVVHPDARGRGIATRLGEHLCNLGRTEGLAMLSIKQVSTHSQSQHLARRLGFHTTALLMDYVPSPFGTQQRESIVLGCLPLQPRPLPTVALPGDDEGWLDSLADVFGSTVPVEPLPAPPLAPMRLASDGKRVEVTFNRVEAGSFKEVARLPHDRLVYIYVPLDKTLPSNVPSLKLAGYASAGIMPAPNGRWYYLMQRGYTFGDLSLQCNFAQRMYDSAQRALVSNRTWTEGGPREFGPLDK
ncbi:hypothetical protein BLA50215_07919 [Burkholderia lata]|uniref:GNAT family N-acetyltransferase n=1 Tax=Burkholderia lata (strain ATCC 17760 / DSM 23089 / LMG 22485 / NCIMB 9086 / R18194 / 383) TaxID=482957 RepID=UPI0014548E7A|nr:GNAT family N-acetyltransferase [Burkholderia lata]VWD64825.1 hypothetical protein BLA50215_07919 [Burkholderia lata]